nr:MAG TPA: hypothetical protein [Caudoviricetes sp.]
MFAYLRQTRRQNRNFTVNQALPACVSHIFVYFIVH